MSNPCWWPSGRDHIPHHPAVHVNPAEIDAGCVGTVDGSKARAHEHIAVRPSVVVISADNRAFLKHGRFLRDDASTGKSHRRELTVFQQEANEIAGVVTSHSDDF